MKKSILILAATFLIGASLTSCKKEKVIAPQSVEVVENTNTFTGVVFTQLKADSTSLYQYGVHRIVSANVVDSLLPLHAWTGLSNNVSDTFTVNFSSGDSVHVGAYKPNNEPFIEPLSQNINFKIRTQIFLNGVIVFDTTSIGGQYWLKLP